MLSNLAYKVVTDSVSGAHLAAVFVFGCGAC